MVLSLYELAWRPAAAIVRRTDPQLAHARTVTVMRRADELAGIESLARLAHRYTFRERPTQVGRVRLPNPLILAAGLVKGDGFEDESRALAAVGRHRNIVPGWRSVPALVGATEFGSFTRHPRRGNAGRVLWRDNTAWSMQNRVGLRNPGIRAAASHLRSHEAQLPTTWGINLAVSPGLGDVDRQVSEIEESAVYCEGALADLRRSPAWYTLNLSCPNTEDDPHGNQTESLAGRLCQALVENVSAPVWVKVGPDLSDAQLVALVRAFDQTGVRAVVATNTLPGVVRDADVTAGLIGAPLRSATLSTIKRLAVAIDEAGAGLDIVASGGVLHGGDLLACEAAGAKAAMLYTALVFRGPLAGALILREAERGR